MAHRYDHLREKAIKLRTEQNMTIDDLIECLQLPRATLYYWIKDIPIPRTQKQTLDQRRKADLIRQKAAAVRQQWYQEGAAEVQSLLQDLTFRDFVVLYMAEGYKRNRNVVSFVNSDPHMVKIANKWIKQFATNKLAYRLQYHTDHDVDELKNYWAGILGIEPAIISVMRKSNSNQLAGRKYRSVYGLLTVSTGDTQFRSRLQAWIDYIKAQW
ncbi:MAG: hypothetical protein J0M07_19810 [Anaerolineae bacterium]|nr:hypothetical protein [Anaerolineae bacterium]